MKLLRLKFLIWLCILLFTSRIVNSSDEKNYVEDIHFEKEIHRLKDIYSKHDNILSELVKDIDLYTPHFNFEQPEKYRKESYWKMYSGDNGKSTDLPNDIYIIPEELIEDTENINRKNIMERLIKKELNMDEVKLKDYHEIYGYPDAKSHYTTIAKISDSNTKDIRIKNFSEISEIISFEPKEIILQDKPILIPTMAVITIRNTMEEDLIINSVKSDLYQMTIFYFKPGKDSNQSFNQKNVYPKVLHSGEEMLFQIIILADMVGKIRGNIYFEIGKSTIIIYPVIINAVENVYRVHPVYSPNWLGSKLLTIPLNIYNPHSKTLIIKEVMNSFTSINLLWPNGESVSSNNPSISSSMLEIPPKSNKNIMVINFYKDCNGAEYGLIQMKTDKDTLIIPVFMRVEIKNLQFYPNIINFGVIDLNQNIKRSIPLTISNVGPIPIELKMMYINYEENLVNYLPNLNKNNKCFKTFNEDKKTFNENIHSGNKKFEKNVCLLENGEIIENFGYLVFDPKNYLNEGPVHRHVRGSILFQTNLLDNPFIELNYEYHIDREIILPFNYNDNFRNGQFILNIPPDYSKNEKNLLKYEIDFKLKTPFHISYSTISEKGYYYFYATNNYLSNNNTINQSNPFPRMELLDKTDFTRLIITFDLSVQETTTNSKKFLRKIYHIPIPSTFDSIVLIPIKLVDYYVDVYCCYSISNPEEFFGVSTNVIKKANKKNSLLSMNLGMVSVSETAINYFLIVNDNDKDLNIIDMKTTNGDLLLGLDSILDIETMEKVQNKAKNILDNDTLQNLIKRKFVNRDNEKIQLGLMNNSITVFSVIMNSYLEQDMTETLTITFENTNRLYVNVKAKFLKGNLNISPSLIRFEPAFPGFYQYKFVSSKSSYNQAITINSVESMDKRIIPVLLADQIVPNNRTEIIKIDFDPSKVSLGENFMKGDFLFNTTTRYLSFKELYLWKEKQKLWELLGSQGRTEINTSVNIKTSIQSETVQIRAFLTKPSLFKKDDIDFGLVQIGESVSKYIEVYNPSDEVITIQVLLATEEFADIYNDKIFEVNKNFNFKQNNEITLMDCNFFNSNYGNPVISLNSTQNSFSQTNPKKKKRKEDVDGIDINNSIILDEDYSGFNSFDNKILNKVNLLKKIFNNSSHEIQNSINYVKKVICNVNHLKKDDIIMNRKELSDKLFSEDFNKEIAVVKKMTDCPPPANHQNKISEGNLGLFEQFADFLKYFFKTEIPKKNKFNASERLQQEFYIPKIVSSQIYFVKPHQKMKIGPIIYHPSNLLNNTATLFIKNNLTILYPIKLKGSGGSGTLNFSTIESETIQMGYQRKKEIEIINNKLIYEIDTDEEDTVLTKLVRVKNTGNLPVKINNISIENSECESYGIKISNCNSIYLKPEESYKLIITLIPDFNFYFFEKDIIFSTEYGQIVLKISVNINYNLLSAKNSLFNYEQTKNFGYVSVFMIIFVICVILYLLTNEFEEITKTKIKTNHNMTCLSSNDVIDTSPTVKFENLFIKSYRKYNHGFYDDFMLKQFDKPGTGNYDIDTLGDKKKTNIKLSKEKRSEEFPKELEIAGDKESLKDCLINENVIKVEKIESTVKENKDKTTDNLTNPPVNIVKQTNTKKVNENKNRKTNKKHLNRPIGMPYNLKVSTEKKEEITFYPTEQSNTTPNTFYKKNSDTINNNNNNQTTNLPKENTSHLSHQKQESFYSTSNYNMNSHIQYQRYGIKEDFNNNMNYYNYYDNNNNFDHSLYNNYWQKNYYNKQMPQRYDYNGTNNRYNYYTKQYDGYYNYNNFNTSNKSFNYFNHSKNNETIGFKSNINRNQSNVCSHTETTNANNATTNYNELNQGVINQSKSNLDSSKVNEKNLSEELNASEKEKEISGFNSITSGNNQDRELSVEDNSKINNKHYDNPNEGDLNKNVNHIPFKKERTNNVEERFNSFLPDFYSNQIKDASERDSNSYIKQDNCYSIKPNFDFSDIFNKPEDKQIQDEYKNINEEDASSHNYLSEREKIDSGAEEFKFNFNSIFMQNKSNMKLPENYNENTDHEDLNNANKPYFDKNLLFPAFEWNKSQNGFFLSVNPFSNNTNRKLLDELREENNDEEEVEEKPNHKTDDIADEEYDEEEPLWNSDPTDIKEEGYFDVNGTYKLKQIDFNFDLDFKMKK